MSMNTYGFSAPLCVQIDHEFAAHILRAYDLSIPNNNLRNDLRALYNDEKAFTAAAKLDNDPVLKRCDCYNIAIAAETLYDTLNVPNISIVSEFAGNIRKLYTDGETIVSTDAVYDTLIAVILPERELSYFTAAYTSVDEFVEEVRGKLYAAIPDLFKTNALKLESKLCAVDGSFLA